MSAPSSASAPSTAFGQLVLAATERRSYVPSTLRELFSNEQITPELAKLYWQKLLAGDEPHLSCQDEIIIIGGDGMDPYYLRSMPVMKGLLLFIQEINQTPDLKIKGFQFNGVFFDENVWRSFIQNLENIPQIDSLHFIACGLESHMIHFMAFFAPSLRDRLTGLSFDQNDITPGMAAELKNLLSSYRSLVGFSLNSCGISETCFNPIIEGLQEHPLMQELDLSNNHLGDDAALQLGLHLRGLRMLRYLYLKGNPITDRGLAFFSPFLQDSSILELDLSHNGMVTHRGVKRILTDGQNLSRLSLSQNLGITSPSFIRKANRAARLKFLDVSGTGITDVSMLKLASRKLRARRSADNKLIVVFSPDGKALTVEGLVKTREGMPANIDFHQKAKKEKAPSFRHPALDEPLYQEILAAPQATAEFLTRIRDYSHPNPETEELIKEFCFKTLLEKQFDIIPIDPDGNCLFASMAECLGHKKKADWHYESCQGHMTGIDFRGIVMDYIKKNWETFAPFIEDVCEPPMDPQQKVLNYCQRKSDPTVWGEEMEVQAITAVLTEMHIKRPIWIFDRRSNNSIVDGKITVPTYFTYFAQAAGEVPEEPILLYRLNDNHYSSMFPKEGENKRQGPDERSDVSEKKRVRFEKADDKPAGQDDAKPTGQEQG